MPLENKIETYLHCKKCLLELPDGQSPIENQWISVGWTEQGFQVWCDRHGENVIHIDFKGQKVALVKE